MTNEFAIYIHGLTGELAKNIWLDAFINRKRNGTSTIVIRDIAMKYRITDIEFKNLFDYKHAEKIGLIKVLAEGQTFISVNFNNKVVPVKIEASIQSAENRAVAKSNPEKALTLTQQDPNIVLNEYGLIISPIDKDYKMTEKCKRYIVFFYCEFFKKLQINRSILAGMHTTAPVNPRISPKEIAQLKEIAMYFVSTGINTEVKIIFAFQRIYDQWDNLSERLQRMSSPGGMLFALNDIIQELAQIKKKQNQPPKPTAKDEQFNSKVDAAKQKDYSHLAKP